MEIVKIETKDGLKYEKVNDSRQNSCHFCCFKKDDECLTVQNIGDCGKAKHWRKLTTKR